MKSIFKENNVDSKKIFDKETFLFAFLGTIICHGEIIFNKISWHDDMAMTFSAWGQALSHGRWLNHFMIKLLEKVAGGESLGVPNGIIVGFSIAVMSCLLFYIFGIFNKYVRIALMVVFIGLPAVAANFGYMSASGMNFIGLMLCVLALYFMYEMVENDYSKGKGILLFIAASFLACLAIGQYQCFFTYYLSLLLTYLIKICVDHEEKFSKFFAKFFGFIFSVFLALVFYLIILKISLSATGAELADYSGIDSFGLGTPLDYWHRVCFAYLGFIKPSETGYATMFPFHFSGWHILLLIFIVVVVGYYLISKLAKKKIKEVIELIICLILFPLAINFNFVLFGTDGDYHAIHALHMYQMILTFALPFIFLCSKDFKVNWDNDRKIIKYFFRTLFISMTALTFVIGCFYVRYDNFCYMTNEMRQEKAISYLTTLRSRIESTEGYDSSMLICFINDMHKVNLADDVRAQYDYPATYPFDSAIINSNYWYYYMMLWIGWQPPTGDSSWFENDERVQAMPSYPSDGSIQIIDGSVVVKF